MSLWRLTEVVPYFVFADSDQVFVSFRTSFVFQHFYAVEVMFDMIVGIDDDAAGVPLARGVDETLLFIGFYEIIERGQRAVAVPA